MINTFADKPEFIGTDPRQRRPAHWQYTVTAGLMTQRHDIFFKKTQLTGARVLDLGACCAATGAWVLDRGAAHYTGVELQEKFVASARNNLQQYYPADQWSIVQSDLEQYIDSCEQQFDVVLLAGVLHCLFDYHKILRKLTGISQQIIIECFHPYNGLKDLYPELDNDQRYALCRQLSLAQIAAETGTAGENGGSWVFDGVRLSMAATQNVFGYLGWKTDLELNDYAVAQLPEVYSMSTPSYCPRYVVQAEPGQRTVFEFADGYADPKQSNYEYKNW